MTCEALEWRLVFVTVAFALTAVGWTIDAWRRREKP